ncbi:MAG: response regulator, partial [Verrucomicrobiota bacterium]
MAHRILIVDDDQEFNVLLTDVFSQADYEVETCGDASSALERLAAGGIDLLVTDFRMPGPSGLDLVRRVRELQRELPIIMVSGYLDNGMIRDLIRLGVGGIFMKPLNIFSLLKKTGELIEREEQRESEEAPVEASGFGANVGYRFRAFPCRDACSRDFAKRLFEMRNFAKNLLLIAESGTDLRTLAEDLAA